MRPSRTAPRRPGLPLAGAAASIALAAFLAAACGTARAPEAPGKPAGVALAGLPADSRPGATAYARRLLASLRLPPGARKLPWPAKLPAGLSPTRPAILSDFVDVKALYRVSESMSATYDFLLAHHPAGTRPDGYGQGGVSGTVTAQFADFTRAHPPGGIFTAELSTVIKPGRGGGSLLRADAIVAWYPPRGRARRIDPAGYRAVTVRWLHGYSVIARTLTSRHAVLYFAGLYNGLHGAPDVVTHCPGVQLGSGRNQYQIVFSPARGQPSVVASPTSCMVVGVSIGGRQVSGLYPATGLLSAATRAMHDR